MAKRNLRERTALHLTLGTILALSTFFPALLLFFTRGVAATVTQALACGPDLIVRKVDSQGWQWMTPQEWQQLSEIPGVMRAEGRLWGVMPDPMGTATAFFSRPWSSFLTDQPKTAPNTGEGEAALRQKWSLPEEVMTDVALWTFHESEAQLIQEELYHRFQGGLVGVTRKELVKQATVFYEQKSSLHLSLFLPTLISTFLVFLGGFQDLKKHQAHIGLQKLLGMTSWDLFRMQVMQTLLTGVPVFLIALGLAGILVNTGLQSFLFPWVYGLTVTSVHSLRLSFSPLLVLFFFIFLPWCVAQWLPHLNTYLTDPNDVL
jgi:hypothetical protein